LRLTWLPIDEPTPTLDDTQMFVDERGFFRAPPAGAARRDPLARFTIEAGPPWERDEANAQVRRFLDLLADGRPIAEEHDDPLEYAQRNGLLLLIGPDEERTLARMAKRMPRDMAVAWKDALRGGHASDAFGPLSEPERLDEKRVEAELRSGDRGRKRNLLVGSGLVVVLVAAVAFFALRDTDDGPDSGAITFDPTPEETGGNDRSGPAPAVVPALVARLDRPVAVTAGDAPQEERIVIDPPLEDLPQQPGAIAATLFRFNGAGQVVLVGPAGWLANACIEVSPIAPSLRAFEVAFHETAPGACPDSLVGRDATVGCLSDTTIMLDLLRIPEGEVGLEEGGTASIAAVRVKVVGNDPRYEYLSVNGQIAVAAGSEVTVPTFGGAVGETVNFDLSGADGSLLVGSCPLA
jgi:hypothetical protein